MRNLTLSEVQTVSGGEIIEEVKVVADAPQSGTFPAGSISTFSGTSSGYLYDRGREVASGAGGIVGNQLCGLVCGVGGAVAGGMAFDAASQLTTPTLGGSDYYRVHGGYIR